jgi:trehalose 6-phosphate synthase
MFLRLPWRAEVLRALLDYDLVGFQTLRDRRNFLYCVRHLLPDCTTKGQGSVVGVQCGEREVRVGSFPISIDYADFARRAAGDKVQEAARTLRRQMGETTLILGIDRLDYTKGIPEKLDAFRRALLRYPELQGTTTLVQVAVPSRLDVPEYQDLRARIERLVGEINGQFTRAGWAPIHYIFRALDRTELLAHYVAADVALITPLKDGMNLVSKEYCASNTHENGTLILSEFAGSASQMHRWALTVNPHDVDGVATAIYRACTMTAGERRSRMRHMRRSIKGNDIYKWVDDFLRAAASKTLHDFPYEEEYLPVLESREITLDEGSAS